MSMQNADGYIKIAATVPLSPGLLVTPTGALCVASTLKTHIGVSQENAIVGQLTTLLNPMGKNLKVQASLPINVGDPIYYAAAGQVTNVIGTNLQIGVAIDAATGAGSIIEVAFV